MASYLKKNYKKTLCEVQAELSFSERIASKLVHNHLAWKIGEACESVFFRFTPLMTGFAVALICCFLFICVAFLFNYAFLSMHILFLPFITGYIISIIIDYIGLLSKTTLSE